jgi:alanyl-tRNA synthetase
VKSSTRRSASWWSAADSWRRRSKALKAKLASQAGSSLADQAVDVNGIKVLAAHRRRRPQALRDTVDQLKNKLGAAAVVLATVRTAR